MGMNTDHTAIEDIIVEEPGDDLSAMVGVFNGLAIATVFYGLVLTVWWLA